MKQQEEPLWEKCYNSLWARKWHAVAVVAVAAIAVVVYVLAARDGITSEFTVKLTHELAWPVAVFLLFGYFYRAELRGLIDRISEVEAFGVRGRAVPPAVRPDVKREAESTQDEHLRMILRTYRKLSAPALRLLGNLLAADPSRGLPLTMFRRPPFAAAKKELLANGLVEFEGRNYRPTSKAHDVFSVHLRFIHRLLPGEERGQG